MLEGSRMLVGLTTARLQLLRDGCRVLGISVHRERSCAAREDWPVLRSKHEGYAREDLQ